MSEDTHEVEQYQKELSTTVDDGGGCAEIWEAAQESRMVGKRRSFMASMAASLFTGVSISNVSAAETVQTDPKKKIVELTDGEKRRLQKEALSDDRMQTIWREMVSRGLKPNLNSLVGYKTTYEDREWRFVRIPFIAEKRNSLRLSADGDTAETGAIVWNTLEEIDAHGYTTRYEVDYDANPEEVERELRDVGVDVDSMDTVPVVIDHTKFTTEERANVTEETNSMVFPVATAPRVTAQGGCECSSALANPLTACAPCGIPDPDCIADLANVYSLELVACSACIGSSGWLTYYCLACLAAIFEEDDLGFFCCPCKACDGIIVC